MAIYWADTKLAAGSLERLSNKVLPLGKWEFAQEGEECHHWRSNPHPVYLGVAVHVEHDEQNWAQCLPIDSA